MKFRSAITDEKLIQLFEASMSESFDHRSKDQIDAEKAGNELIKNHRSIFNPKDWEVDAHGRTSSGDLSYSIKAKWNAKPILDVDKLKDELKRFPKIKLIQAGPDKLAGNGKPIVVIHQKK